MSALVIADSPLKTFSRGASIRFSDGSNSAMSAALTNFLPPS